MNKLLIVIPQNIYLMINVSNTVILSVVMFIYLYICMYIILYDNIVDFKGFY